MEQWLKAGGDPNAVHRSLKGTALQAAARGDHVECLEVGGRGPGWPPVLGRCLHAGSVLAAFEALLATPASAPSHAHTATHRTCSCCCATERTSTGKQRRARRCTRPPAAAATAPSTCCCAGAWPGGTAVLGLTAGDIPRYGRWQPAIFVFARSNWCALFLLPLTRVGHACSCAANMQGGQPGRHQCSRHDSCGGCSQPGVCQPG